MKINLPLFLSLLCIIIVISLLYFSVKENFDVIRNEESYEQSEELYFKTRIDDKIPSNPAADMFYSYNNADNKLELNNTADINLSDTAGSYQPVDQAVEQCKKINSCDELDGTPCGYCFYNNKFYYGDEKGPKTDVCPGGWVKTKEDCVKRRERAICDKVSSCQNMIGDAAICAWCPTKNKAFVYKTENGKIVPKYEQDICDDIDITTNQNLGLIKQKECNAFKQAHPCIGPNEDTGPHSQQCLNHLWKESGCSVNGNLAPDKNSKQSDSWNQLGWQNILDNMKLIFNSATGSNWLLAKSNHKACLGSDPDPCDPKYNGPLECYQKKFIESGCSINGGSYPKTKPTIGISNYVNSIKDMINKSHDKNIDYTERNAAYKGCYGGELAAPPPIKVGDKVKYVFDSNAWGKDTTIHGYVCEITNNKAKVFWEYVIDNTGKKHARRSVHLDNPELMSELLGSYCGDVPEMFKEIPAQLPVTDLLLESSCNSTTNCSDAGCSMQNIVYIHYPQTSYSVPKNKVNDIISKARQVFNSIKLADIGDIQYLVDIGVPYCACGWVNQNNQLTSSYPSVLGTSHGCGGGKQHVVSCGSNSLSWADGKAGVYVRIDADPSKIVSELKKIGITGSIVATVGKNEYTSLVGNLKPQQCKWSLKAKGNNYGKEFDYTFVGDCNETFNFTCLSDSQSNGSCEKSYNLKNGVITTKNGTIVGNTSCCNQTFRWIQKPTVVS